MKKILHTFCFSLSQRQILILVIVFALLSSTDLQAQCAMCRAALESEEGLEQAKGINNGIIYLMIFPYLLLGILGIVIYKKMKKKE